MDYDEASKDSCSREKHETGNTREEDKASHDTELEEGEFRRDEPFGSVSLVHKDEDAGSIKLSSSAQVVVLRDQVNIPQLEEGEFRRDEPFGSVSLFHKDEGAGAIKSSSSAQVSVQRDQVNIRQSMSPERGSNRGDSANTTAEQSNYTPLDCQSVNVRQSTFHRKSSEEHRRSSSPSFHISSKERQRLRQLSCFHSYEYRHVLEKIEKVCSERLSKLLLKQNGDRKEFNILQKKQELEFFQENVRSYKIRYERVLPTVRYDRIKLPKLLFCTLRETFQKYIQSQLIKFVKRQINDRNKEKRRKERWIFEAKAGYLKKYFDETSLTHSRLEMEKSKWHVHDYFESEQLQYFDMQHLTSAIEAIALGGELADSYTSKNIDVPEPVLENLQTSPETNDSSKHGLLGDAADEMTTIDGMPSQSCAPMGFSDMDEAHVAITSPPKNQGENIVRSCSSEEPTDEASLEVAKEVAVGSDNILSVLMEKRRRTNSGDDASEGSCSRSKKKLPLEVISEFHRTALYDKEPQAAMMSSSVIVNQREQSDNAGREEGSSDQTSSVAQISEQPTINADPSSSTQILTGSEEGSSNQTSSAAQVNGQRNTNADPSQIITCREEGSGNQTSSSAQVNEQPNINADPSTSTQILTQSHHCDLIRQNGIHPYQPSDGDTYSIRTGLGSPEASNVQPTNKMMTRSMVDQYMPEIRLQADPITSELTPVLRSCIDQAPSFAQATEQRNDDSCSSLLTQHETQYRCDQIHQTVAHQYQPTGGNTSSLRTWLDSSGESNVQQQSSYLTTAGSTSAQYMNESGLPSDPFRIELHRLFMLRDIMTKRHLAETQKIILEREMAMVELKRKYDGLFHNLEMERLQKQKDIETLHAKICQQQILAEAFQVMNEASAGLASCSQRVAEPVSGATSRTTEVSNQSSGRQILRIPAPASVSQPRQPAARSSTNHFFCQPSMITQEDTTNTSGRFAPTLSPAPGIVMGTGLVNHAPAPRFRAFLTSLPASRPGAAGLER